MIGEVGGIAPAALAIETKALGLSASFVSWDTESFGVPVAQIGHIEVRDTRQAEGDVHALSDWLLRHGIRLASCRLDHARLRESFLLETVGFRFVEMVYAMQKDIGPDQAAVPDLSGLRWEAAAAEDLPELRRIAAASFVTGRWNVDWRVGEELAGRRYADWVGRSLGDPRHEVLKAMLDDKLAGFFIVEEKPERSVYWHLTAVAPEFHGRGLGWAMWQSMLRRHAVAGLAYASTTISARNVPVVNLYAKLGWRYMTCQMTLHWADPDWEPAGK